MLQITILKLVTATKRTLHRKAYSDWISNYEFCEKISNFPVDLISDL
jgi:hypothetical protein